MFDFLPKRLRLINRCEGETHVMTLDDRGVYICQCHHTLWPEGEDFDPQHYIIEWEGPHLLMNIAFNCRHIYDAVAAIDPDLWGCSLLDLMADRMPHLPLSEIMSAIICSGIYSNANERIQKQIARYGMI